MTGSDLSPLLAEAVREIAQLTAAAASFDEQTATARRVVVAYTTIVYNAHPILGTLCQTECFPSPGASQRSLGTPYYQLNGPVGSQRLYTDQARIMGTLYILGQFTAAPLSNMSNVLASARYGPDKMLEVSVSDKLLIPAFPSVIRSIAYLKEQMRGKDDDLATLWEQLRASVVEIAAEK